MYTLNITLNPHDASDPGRTKLTAAEMLGIDVRTISNLRIKKRSIDARQRNITIHLTVDVYIGGEQVPEEFDHIEYSPVSNIRLAKGEPELTRTANFIRAAKNVGM